MIDQSREFLNELSRFFANVETIGLRRLHQRGATYEQELSPLLGQVISELRSGTTREEFRQAVAASNEEDEGAAIGYLTRELRFFNTLVENPGSGTTAKGGGTSSSDEQLDAAKTIKESVEKWLKVKGRWKRLLEVLNELLSLIKGGS